MLWLANFLLMYGQRLIFFFKSAAEANLYRGYLLVLGMDKKELFLSVFRKAEKKYGGSAYRLAADGWEEDWQTLIATIMSAQSRDETTIPIAERLFIRYDTIEKLAHARYDEVIKILRV